jgi:EmrB/QacA subfamily drug resistance transporter
LTTESVGFDTRQRWLVAICCVAQFMVILDLSIVNVALPSIQLSLGFSSADLQWVVDAYAIVFAGFLMLGGRASDFFGPRRTLVAALAGFSLASLVAGVAPDPITLIAARAGQGLTGALMAAGSLAAITSEFPPGPLRHRAVGLWGAMNGAGGAAGAFFGGLITQELTWRWIFLINPPIGLAAAAGAYLFVRDRKVETRSRFDLAGALTLTGGLVVLVWGIVNAGYIGWLDPLAVGPIVVGVVLLGAFVLVETRFAEAPLVPFRALTSPVRTANVVVLLFSAALFPMWYVSSLYLQQVLAHTPLETGLAFLPMALTIMLTARRTGALVNRFGARPVLGSGLLLMTGGMLLLARIGSSGSAVWYIVLPGILVAGGIGLCVVSSTIAAVQGARPEEAGLASGLVNTSRQVGGALGIALLISIASSRTSHLIGENHGVATALTDGFRLAYLIGAALCAAAAAVAFTRLPAPAAGGSRRRLAVVVASVLVAFLLADLAFAGAPGAPIGAYTTKDTYSYVTAPDLHPPKIAATRESDDAALAPGEIMLTNFYDLSAPPMTGQSGPLIVDNQLQPVWFRPVPTNVVAANLTVQRYRGHPVLSWWQGTITSTGQTESGEYVVVDDRYRTVATLTGKDDWIFTLHELVIDGDHAWVTANKNVPMNLAKYGGAKNGAVVDSAVQEYSLSTGKLLYTWDALDHIPLSESHSPPPPNGFPWDAYHVNSIELEPDGTFLTSMRDTWAAYLVDPASSDIRWTLGGEHSSFTFAPDAAFEWQHDVSLAGSQVTLFDDACCEIAGVDTYLTPDGPSRGVVLHVDQSTKHVTLVRQYMHGDDFEAAYMGSVQTLPNGNTFVGWGAQPYFSEYSQAGKLLLDAVFPAPDLSYRARREQWSATPANPPAAAVRTVDGKTTVYASWNGATAVAAWRVLAGASTAALAPVTAAPRAGFETAIPSPGGKSLYEVQALDANGKVIGTSHVVSSS